MNEKELTTSLELSMELDKRGVKLGTYFRWCWYKNSPLTKEKTVPAIVTERFSVKGATYAEAPTAAELMAVLPSGLAVYKTVTDGTFATYYPNEELFANAEVPQQDADTPQDALAKMLIWLLDNNHLKVGEKGGVE